MAKLAREDSSGALPSVRERSLPWVSAIQRLPVNFQLFVGTISRGRHAGITRLPRRLLVAEQASAAIFLSALRKYRGYPCQDRLEVRQE